jgi:hypothetical protein
MYDLRLIMKSSVIWDTIPCSPLKVNRHVLPKHLLTFNGLHIIISQKVEL